MSRRRRFLVLLALLVIATGAHAQTPEVFSEVITIARYLVAARVLDAQGHEIRDLSADDFTITIGKQPATVASLSWYGRPGKDAAASAALGDPVRSVEPEGRLVVFLVSRDFAADSARLAGQMRFHLLADEIIAALDPGDRVAVFSHNTSLQLRADFTTDRETVRRAIRASILADRISLPPPLEEGPSLVPHLDEEGMRAAWTPEKALLQVARSLVALEREPAALIVGGYGMGERGGVRVTVKREGYEAMDLLRARRVPVIAFNTGIGGQLRLGLIAAAHATGGTYALATSDFPSQHLTRVAGLLAGRYELLLRTERPLASGRHPISIRVKRPNARVHAPQELVIDLSTDSDGASRGSGPGRDRGVVPRRSDAPPER